MRKLIIIFILAVLALAGFFFLKKDDSATDPNTTDIQTEGRSALTEDEAEEIVRMVAAHIQLPDEKPEIGIVTDIELLRSTQPFYAGAENGDILLLYPSISRAILFDPDEDVIINVGPVVFENPEGGPTE